MPPRKRRIAKNEMPPCLLMRMPKPLIFLSQIGGCHSRLGYPLFPLLTDPQFPPRAENHRST